MPLFRKVWISLWKILVTMSIICKKITLFHLCLQESTMSIIKHDFRSSLMNILKGDDLNEVAFNQWYCLKFVYILNMFLNKQKGLKRPKNLLLHWKPKHTIILITIIHNKSWKIESFCQKMTKGITFYFWPFTVCRRMWISVHYWRHEGNLKRFELVFHKKNHTTSPFPFCKRTFSFNFGLS